MEWGAGSAVPISCSIAEEEEDGTAEKGTGDRKARRKNKKRRNRRNRKWMSRKMMRMRQQKEDQVTGKPYHSAETVL